MKHFKMMLYGEPGVGKSTFAGMMPKPFFICTDGNYDYLDLPDEDHVVVSNWKEGKAALKSTYDNYETVVVDLTEDLFKWCEKDICTTKKIDHPSDLDWGKGWSMIEDEFINTLNSLIALDKNIILLSHESIVQIKNRHGVAKDKFKPSDRIRAKIFDAIEGKMKYVLRCYLAAEETEEYIIKKRMLSLVPKENEVGICRGLDESKIPTDIDLDVEQFLDIINNPEYKVKGNIASITKKSPSKQPEQKKVVKESVKEASEKLAVAEEQPHQVEETKVEVSNVEEEVVEKPRRRSRIKEEIKVEPEDADVVEEEVKEEPVKVEVKQTTVETKVEDTQNKSRLDKLAELKAKIAARKK